MNFEDIIKNKSVESTQSVNNILNNHKNYNLELSSDGYENKIIDVFGNNDKKILSVKYEILGTYDSNLGVFSWACDQIIVDKKMTQLAKSIKSYSKKIKKIILLKKFSDVEFMERLYYYTTNSLFFVNDFNLNDIFRLSIHVTNAKGILSSSVGKIDSIDKISGSGKQIKTFYLITDIISF